MKHSDALKALAPVDLSKPSLKALAYLLRHPELWPTNFGPWQWWDSQTCAIGLAAQVWHGEPCTVWASRAFNLDHTCISHLFCRAETDRRQPANVADRIDHFLATTAF